MKNRVRIIKKEFKVDEKNKVVVCELLFTLQLLGSGAIPNIMDIPGGMAKKRLYQWGDTLVCRGKARCSSDDTFDETVGRRIAECRAKIKMFKVARNVWKTLGNDLAERVLSCRTLSNTCDVAMDIETWHLKKLLP